MATEEMKPETKKTQQKQNQSQQVKEDLPTQILPPLPLPYKSCSFKVSIHCEGCKRKVKKILTSIEGVYKVDIDVKQHKVTVLGIISPEILLKKLHKAGKSAVLLPEIPDPEETKPVDPELTEKKKNKKKKKEEKTDIVDGGTSSESDKPESEITKAAGECSSGVGGGGGGEVVKAPSTSKTCGPVEKEKKIIPNNKVSDQEKSPSPEEYPAPATEKKDGENGGPADNGNICKKKKKKEQNLSTPHKPAGTPERTQSLPPATDLDRPINPINGHHILTNNYPPRHDLYPYPPPSYYEPQVMYGVSYNVAQPPVSVDAASYYTPPPPYSYAYMHPGYQPSDQNYSQSRPSDSFELFSDENPNGCLVM